MSESPSTDATIVQCPSEEQLAGYVAGGGSPGELAAVRAHIESCSQCRRWVEQDQADGAWLHDVLGAADKQEIRADSQAASETPDVRYTFAGSSVERLVTQGLLERSTVPHYVARLGPYQISDYIGRGGMGIVLKAYEVSLNRTVALKILRPDLAVDETAIRRFEQEAKAAAGLQHANIITVHAVGQEHGVFFLAMEYIEGPTLAAKLNRHGPLPGGVARGLFRQILSGLESARNAGLIHRDIKPSNILLDATELQAKISDFGLARMATARTRLTLGDSVLGTPEYMSPEQARGDQDIDHRADLYSAGVVLYEMLTGRTPFVADSPSAVIHRILTEEPVNPRAVSRIADPHLASLALRLIAKRPGERFESAAEALAALDSGHRIHSLERRRWRRRRLVALSLILATLAAGAWLLSEGFTPPAITKVWSIPDHVDKAQRTVVWADYADGRTQQRFYDFGEQTNRVVGAILLNRGDVAAQIVVAGIHRPIDGDCLFAFDAGGHVHWRMDLSSDRQWPDCLPPASFQAHFVTRGDLDGRAGDEIVVSAGDWLEYPTRISIIDPQTREIRSTFWHAGHLNEVFVVPGFFDGDRPAIVARGQNNKLDGFEDGSQFDDLPLADYDVVSVLMILDPERMDGLGPVLSRRFPDEKPASVHAYVFLNLAPDDSALRVSHVGSAGRRVKERPADDLPREELGVINSVEMAQRKSAAGTGPWLEVAIVAKSEDEEYGRAYLVVDRDLRLQAAEPVNVGGEIVGDSVSYWKQHWIHLPTEQ